MNDKILELIWSNDIEGLKAIKVVAKNINWVERHVKTDLDDKITPLACAAFLGRAKIVELLLENPWIDINQPTFENEYSPLASACMAGQFETVKILCENGADVNCENSMGQSPLLFCFSRMTETTNVYENKNICIMIAEILL